MPSSVGPSRSSLAEQVISTVRAWISSGELAPGELYSVYQLAERLDVSRSPVREGLLRLSEAGMIAFERNRGFRVVVPRPQDIAEIFALRLALEVPAARRVAERGATRARDEILSESQEMSAAVEFGDERVFTRHDQSFHDAILRHAGNERARAIVAGLRDTTQLIGASTVESTRTLRQIHLEHDPILEAIAAADPHAAELAMRRHLVNTGQLLVRQSIDEQGVDLDPVRLWDEIVG